LGVKLVAVYVWECENVAMQYYVSGPSQIGRWPPECPKHCMLSPLPHHHLWHQLKLKSSEIPVVRTDGISLYAHLCPPSSLCPPSAIPLPPSVHHRSLGLPQSLENSQWWGLGKQTDMTSCSAVSPLSTTSYHKSHPQKELTGTWPRLLTRARAVIM